MRILIDLFSPVETGSYGIDTRVIGEVELSTARHGAYLEMDFSGQCFRMKSDDLIKAITVLFDKQ